MYSIGGIYRHPNGNVSHFVSALELLLNDLDNGRTTIIAGDMNIHIIKFTNIDVISYMTTMMAYKYQPYITLPSRITQLSTTCIDHIFMKKSNKAKILNTLCGLYYCDISDHLPFFLSLKFEKYNCVSERPMTRLFESETVVRSYNLWNKKTGKQPSQLQKMIGITNSLP